VRTRNTRAERNLRRGMILKEGQPGRGLRHSSNTGLLWHFQSTVICLVWSRENAP